MGSRLRLHLGVAIVFGGALATPGFLAAATPDTATHQVARRALADQNYLGVIDAYKGFTDLNTAAKYRLSIAFSKTDNPVKAYSLLQQAIAEDPKGTFASSPQRLQVFKESLLISCAESGAPGCVLPDTLSAQVASTTPETSVEILAPTPSGSAVTPSSSIDTSPQSASVESAAIDRSTPLTEVKPTQAVQTQHSLADNQPRYWLMDAFVAVVAGVLGWLVLLVVFKGKQKAKAGLVNQPVQALTTNDSRVDSLAIATKLHQAILQQIHLLPNSHVLSFRLLEILPLIEQEIGRAHLAKHGDASKLTGADARLHQVRQRHKDQPILISMATPEEVSALFQSTRLNLPTQRPELD